MPLYLPRGLVLRLLVITAACSCATAPEGHQSAHGVDASITKTRVGQNCAEIDVSIRNNGKQDAFLIISRHAPFVDFITPRQSITKPAQEEYVRLSLAERLPFGWVIHPLSPDQIRLKSHRNAIIHIRIQLPLAEGLIQASSYTGHGYPPPIDEFHVVNNIKPPFWVRVNVGVTANEVDHSLGRTSEEVRDTSHEVLRRQYLIETPNVRLVPAEGNFGKCLPEIRLENTSR